MEKLYKADESGRVCTFYVHKTSPTGLTYLSEWKTAKCILPTNSKLIYGDKPSFFSTKKEAFDKYMAEELDRLQYVTDRFNGIAT